MTLCQVKSASDKKTRIPSYSTHDGETGSRMQFARDWGVGWRETRNYCLVGVQFQFCKMQQVRKDGGDGCTTMHMHLMSLIHTLRRGCDGEFCCVCVLTTINRWKKEGTIRNMNVFNKTESH